MKRFDGRMPHVPSFLEVLDQYGAPVDSATVSVTTHYFYPSMTAPRLDSSDSVEEVATDTKGHVIVQRSKSHQASSVGLSVSKLGFDTQKIGLEERDPDCADPKSPRRVMLWRTTAASSVPTKSIRDGYFGVRKRAAWSGTPIYFDLERAAFVQAGGDFQITVERASFDDRDKDSKPFTVSIRATDGKIFACSRYECDFGFSHGVPSWGSESPIIFHGTNSRDHPNVALYCTFSSRNGKNHGRAAILIDVIGERTYNDSAIVADPHAIVAFKIRAFFNTDRSLSLNPE